MQYIIQKFPFANESVNTIWWRNYDENHKNFPDIDIETYLSNTQGGNVWDNMTNSRGEPLKYETITKDSLDEIDIYLPSATTIPQYIRIGFVISENPVTHVKTYQYIYYYPKNAPSIYNATKDTLSCVVRYVMDKWASFGYAMHNELKTANPQMFFVRKHCNRMLQDPNTNVYYFDCNKQPWLKVNNKTQTNELVLHEKKVYDKDTMRDMAIAKFNTREDMVSRGCQIGLATTGSDKYFSWTRDAWTTASTSWNISWVSGINVSVGSYPTDLPLLTNINATAMDKAYSWGKDNLHEYILTKTNKYHTDTDISALDRSFYIYPITQAGSGGVQDWTSGCNYNYYDKMPTIFKSDEILGRHISPLPMSVIWLLLVYDNPYISISSGSTLSPFGVTANFYWTDGTETGHQSCAVLETIGRPISLPLQSTTEFSTKLNLLKNNFNTNNVYSKTKANNPHLFAPQNWKLIYANSTNNKVELTTDYGDLRYPADINYELLIASNWYSRLCFKHYNDNKLISNTCNELICADASQLPIQSTGYANTWLQQQVLDTGMNALIHSNDIYFDQQLMSYITSPISYLMMFSKPMSFMTGLYNQAYNYQFGLAQYEAQFKSMYNQGGTVNTGVGSSGLGVFNTPAENGLTLYTLGLSDIDLEIINSDDNMYGYYQQKWLAYTDYLNCWRGNYMLCDISKNYNALFSILKKNQTNNLLKVNDSYINEFLNMLNNGITLFVNGTYRDLATDEYNWERIFPAP